MDIQLAPRTTAWRSRGVQRRVVPDHVKTLVDSTYRSPDVAEIEDIFTADDHAEAHHLVSLARTYATSLGRRLRVQPYLWDREPHSPAALATTRVVFEMVDKEPRK